MPTKEHERYLNMVSGATNKEEIWSIIDEEFIRLYTYNIWGGNPLNRIVAEGEWLRKFDFNFWMQLEMWKEICLLEEMHY